MGLTNRQAAIIGLGAGLACGLALGAIIGGGWYWSSQPANRSGSRAVRPRLQPISPVGQQVTAPAGQNPLTPPDAVDAWKQYAPPTTPLANPPSIPGPYGAMPTARGSLVAARIGDKVLAMTGFRRAPTYFLDVNEILDLSNGSWSQGTPHPMRLESANSTVYDDRLFVCGGFDGVRTRREAYWYDPATDNWSRAADMPYPRYGSPAVVGADGKIYVIGHQEQGKDNFIVQVYDPNVDQWTARPAPVDAGGEPAVAVLEERIFLFGGGDLKTNRRENKVLVYYPAGNRWEQAAPMPVARMGGAAAIWNDKVYLFGGQDEPPDRRSYAAATMARVDIYDPATDRWTRARDMAQPRLRLRAVELDDGILLLGGIDGNSNAYAAAELYVP